MYVQSIPNLSVLFAGKPKIMNNRGFNFPQGLNKRRSKKGLIGNYSAVLCGFHIFV